MLHVRVVEAQGLPKMDVIGSVDPYCSISLSSLPYPKTTKVVKKNKTPVWNEEFHFPLHDITTDNLCLTLIDHDKVSADDPISKLVIQLKTIPMSTVVDKWYDMVPFKKVKKGGRLRLVIHIGKSNEKPFYPNETVSMPPQKNQLNIPQQNNAAILNQPQSLQPNMTQQIPNPSYQTNMMIPPQQFQSMMPPRPYPGAMMMPQQNYQQNMMMQQGQQFQSTPIMQPGMHQMPAQQYSSSSMMQTGYPQNSQPMMTQHQNYQGNMMQPQCYQSNMMMPQPGYNQNMMPPTNNYNLVPPAYQQVK